MDRHNHLIDLAQSLEKYFLPAEIRTDKTEMSVARPLLFIIIFSLALIVLYFITWAIIFPQWVDRLSLSLPSGIFMVAALGLLRTGRVWWATQIYVWGIWIPITLVMLVSGGTRAPIFGIYVVIAMMAALFSGWRYALFHILLATIIGLILAVVDPSGHILQPFGSALSAWLIHVTSMFMVLGVVYVMLGRSEQALKRTQTLLAERENMQRSFITSEERFRLISSVTSDYTFASRIDPDGTVSNMMITGAFEDITGYEQDEFEAIGGWRATIHPDDREKDERDLTLLKQNQQIVSEIRIIAKHGDVRWVRINAIPVWDDENNRLIGINGGVRDITEQKMAEFALRSNEERFRTFIEQAGEGILLTDEAGFIITWNKTMADLTGIKRQEALGQTFWDMRLSVTIPPNVKITPADRESARQVAMDMLQTGTGAGMNQTIEGTHYLPNGEEKILQQRMFMIRGEKGWRIGALFQDVTDRKTSEMSILQLNNDLNTKAEQLETINDIARDISVVTDLTSTLKRILEKLQAILPVDAFYVGLVTETDIEFPIVYDGGQFWKKDLGRVRPSSGFAQVLQTGEPLLINRTPAEIAERERDKSIHRIGTDRVSASILLVPLPIAGKPIGVISVQSYTLNSYTPQHTEILVGAGYQIAIAVQNARLYDSLRSELNERKRLEGELQAYTTKLETLVDERTNALQSANEQLALVLNNTADALAFADSRGDLLVTNPAFRRTFQGESKQSIESILASLVDEEQVEFMGQALLRTIYDNEIQQLETQIISSDGTIRDMDVILLPVPIDDDQRNGVLLSGHDITQMKEIERFKARFIADAVHDLATPISALNTRLYLLKRSPDRLDDHVRALENQVTHLGSLLDDLRTLSHLDRGQLILELQMCSINALVQVVYDTYEPVALDKQQNLVMTVDETLPRTRIDERQMSRVLVNLVSNAVNYTPEQADKRIHIETQHSANEVIIQVADEGMGISAEDQQHIFDRFYRTPKARTQVSGGTGLGLAITKEIVELHGGSIHVDSQPGKGSTFTVRLPIRSS